MSDRAGNRDEAWIRTMGPEQAEGWLAKLYSALTGGQPLSHILGIQTLHPEALEAHYELYRTLMFGPSPLSRSDREAIAVVVSAANGCFY